MIRKLFSIPDDWAQEIQRIADTKGEAFTTTALKLLRPQLEQERRKHNEHAKPLSDEPRRGGDRHTKT